jgi:hypothetical protein
MKRTSQAAAALAFVVAAAAAEATVVCQKKSGVLVVRDTCRKKETAADLASLGVLGPKGDKGNKGDKGDTGDPGEARAYACSESFDELSPSLCANRPSRNVLSVVANDTYPGYTCFVLDPSIDANPAVVVASLTGGTFGGGKINTIIAAAGFANYLGCPANSVVVITARHTNDTRFLGLEYTILGVNIAVM